MLVFTSSLFLEYQQLKYQQLEIYSYRFLTKIRQSTEILVMVQEDDPLQCSINFCRLVLLYVKQFECTDVARSLDYTYFLRKMESPVGTVQIPIAL